MSMANWGNPIMSVSDMAMDTVDEGGLTVTRHHKLATTGYSIGTNTVSVKTPVKEDEIIRAIQLVSGVLNRSINGMYGVEYRNPDDKFLGIGTWITDDKKSCITELVHIYPLSYMDEDIAKDIGRLRKQFSIYLLDEHREIKTGYSETFQG